jgi:hypothetical protein
MRTVHNYSGVHGRSRRRCDDNIKMDLEEIGYENVDCIHLALHRDQ